MLKKLMTYKAWANDLTFASVTKMGEAEATKHRTTRWESIAYTLSHVWVVDDLFRRHLEGRTHSYTFRNIPERLPASEIYARQREIDAWYIGYAQRLSEAEAAQTVEFEYVGGGSGAMTRAEILLHIVNHGTYHRGLVSDMMYQIPITPLTNDLTVFLRDHWSTQQETHS